MTRLINEPVAVRAAGGKPRAFRFRGRWREIVAILDSWREAGEWWEESLDRTERVMFRVQVERGGLFELEWHPASKDWRLYKAYD